jgi:hypothetical protein
MIWKIVANKFATPLVMHNHQKNYLTMLTFTLSVASFKES